MSGRSLVTAVCPICAHAVAAPFFDGGLQALATLGWPASAEAARAMPGLPHYFVQCPQCTHVWNCSFSYEAVPYSDNPNRMFNAGVLWKGHLASSCDLLVRQMPSAPMLLEIGCGEGHFLRAMAGACGVGARIVGFDPSTHPATGHGFEFHARLFEPLVDVPTFAPDAIVIRHVLEHLTNPATLLDQLAWGASQLKKEVYLFAECPCIDRVFTAGRLADFFYEHVSHFTTESFRKLLGRSGEILELSHGYDGEVVYALVKLGVPRARLKRAARAMKFENTSQASRAAIRVQLDELAASDLSIAIWGGTGKAAAFMHQFGVDAARFPMVVDSDPDKAGTFVPGLGQEIVFRDALKGRTVDIVIIPTQWRAADIVAEMAREGIRSDKVLIEHRGQLIDYYADEHPYR